MTPAPILLSLRSAASAVDLSEKTLIRAIHAGDLAAKRVGREYRIPVTALEKWAVSLPDAEAS